MEDHLTECAPCAEEALRLRDAVGLLHPEESLDLKPLLRSRVLEDCLGKAPGPHPRPGVGDPVRHGDRAARRPATGLRRRRVAHARTAQVVRDERRRSRDTTVAGVIGHLLPVDGLVATALGLDDPLGAQAPAGGTTRRTEFFWDSDRHPAPGRSASRGGSRGTP
ncbi:MDMPI N domain containing protein, partial [Streptomyces cirratus]